jgi:hypothetical protein
MPEYCGLLNLWRELPAPFGVESVRQQVVDKIGAVVLADLPQIEADAATRPGAFARDRIIKAVTRLRDIAQGNISADVAGQNEMVIA